MYFHVDEIKVSCYSGICTSDPGQCPIEGNLVDVACIPRLCATPLLYSEQI